MGNANGQQVFNVHAHAAAAQHPHINNDAAQNNAGT